MVDWKKDIGFGRAPKGEDAPEPAAEASPAPEAETLSQLPPPIPVSAPPPAPEAAPAPADEPDAGDYGWLTAAIEEAEAGTRSWTDRVDEGPPSSIAAPPALPSLDFEPAPAPAPAPSQLPPPPPVAAALSPLPPPPPAAVVPTAPPRAAVPPPAPGIHPPVPAAELPPLPSPVEAGGDETAAPQRSLLKRELSFRRKPKAAKPPQEPRAKKDKAPKAERGEKPSFLRTELSFGRKPKAEKAPKAEKPPKEPRAKRVKEPRAKGPKASKASRQKRIVGLKIGASQLAAARVENNGSAHLVQVARRDLEPGIVVGGELRDPESLAEELRAFFKEHRLPRKGVRLGIANNRIGVRTFDVSGIDDPKQLTNAIRFRAQEALPIPIEEAVLDYRILGETRTEEGELVRRILLVVAYRELVDRYVDACKRAGIQLAGIDLEAFALLRALVPPPEEGAAAGSAATVAVSIGHDRTTFAVSNGHVCEFTRVLDWGGSSLDVALARALDLAPSEARPVKEALGVAGVEVDGLTAEQLATARDAMAKGVQAFARELVSSLQFYQNQPGSLGIAEIMITGGTAHLAGLAEELNRLIGVPVRVADPLARLRVGKRVRDDDRMGSLAVAIGLGIED